MKLVHTFSRSFEISEAERGTSAALERAEELAGAYNRPGLGMSFEYADLPNGGEIVTVTYQVWRDEKAPTEPAARRTFDFWTWFDRAKAEAEATEAGKRFLAAGFAFHTTGGGCTAWIKRLADGREIIATDTDGSTHEASTGWLLGLDTGVGAEWKEFEFAVDDLAGLLATAERYKAA